MLFDEDSACAWIFSVTLVVMLTSTCDCSLACGPACAFTSCVTKFNPTAAPKLIGFSFLNTLLSFSKGFFRTSRALETTYSVTFFGAKSSAMP